MAIQAARRSCRMRSAGGSLSSATAPPPPCSLHDRQDHDAGKRQEAKCQNTEVPDQVTRDECFCVLRALELAKDWPMRTASPNERSVAAMEAAELVAPQEQLLAELVAQGFTNVLRAPD